jgi:hypothetical protein
MDRHQIDAMITGQVLEALELRRRNLELEEEVEILRRGTEPHLVLLTPADSFDANHQSVYLDLVNHPKIQIPGMQFEGKVRKTYFVLTKCLID